MPDKEQYESDKKRVEELTERHFLNLRGYAQAIEYQELSERIEAYEIQTNGDYYTEP